MIEIESTWSTIWRSMVAMVLFTIGVMVWAMMAGIVKMAKKMDGGK